MQLKTAMMAVALVAVLLGGVDVVRRRVRRLDALARQYSLESNRLDDLWSNTPGMPLDEQRTLVERIHWLDSVAEEYRQAAARPWIPSEVEPGQVICRCSYHAALGAGAMKSTRSRASDGDLRR